MLSYILLFSLITIVILGVIRASKQKYPGARPQKEPFLGTLNQADLPDEPLETVGKPRIIRSQPAKSSEIIEPVINTNADDIEEGIIAVRKAVPHNEPTSIAPAVATPTKSPQLTIEAEPAPIEEDSTLGDIIVINLVSHPQHPYRGYELLQAMLTTGLRYGKWNIFHRHEEITGRGAILFSLASTVEPGTFDLAKMGSFSTPGLSLFMRISSTQDPAQVFEKLFATAQQLVGELGGNICDEHRIPLSDTKLAQWRSQLQQLAVA